LDKNVEEVMVGHGADDDLVLNDKFFGHAAVKSLDDVNQFIIDHIEDSYTFNYMERHC